MLNNFLVQRDHESLFQCEFSYKDHRAQLDHALYLKAFDFDEESFFFK